MRAATLRRFLGALLENWATAGWDRARSGFHERLADGATPAPGDRRRLLTCARQLYLWSRGPLLAGLPPRRDMADAAFHSLTEHFQDRTHGGFWFSVDLDGRPLDRRKDLYGHAFVLFALAHYHAGFGSAEAMALARTTEELLRERLHGAGGWLAASAEPDWSAPDRALAQNPHMHLLEAYLALETADGDQRWRAGADAMVDLFEQRLFDPAQGVLGEFYDEDGKPHPETGMIVEPGHHFEWCWLLHAYAEQRGRQPSPAAQRLFDWAVRHGTDIEYGGIYDRVDRSGRVLLDSKRIWPICERIKAHAARWRHSQAPALRDGMLSGLDFLEAHYLRSDGSWQEWLDRTLRPNAVGMPGTTPYHLLMTIDEVLPILMSRS